MIKFFSVLCFAIVIQTCGFKGSPSPMFGNSDDRLREEVAKRRALATPVPLVGVTPTATPGAEAVASEVKPTPGVELKPALTAPAAKGKASPKSKPAKSKAPAANPKAKKP